MTIVKVGALLLMALGLAAQTRVDLTRQVRGILAEANGGTGGTSIGSAIIAAGGVKGTSMAAKCVPFAVLAGEITCESGLEWDAGYKWLKAPGYLILNEATWTTPSSGKVILLGSVASTSYGRLFSFDYGASSWRGLDISASRVMINNSSAGSMCVGYGNNACYGTAFFHQTTGETVSYFKASTGQVSSLWYFLSPTDVIQSGIDIYGQYWLSSDGGTNLDVGLTTSGPRMKSGASVWWTDSATSMWGTIDTGLRRDAAGVLKPVDGSGNLRDFKARNLDIENHIRVTQISTPTSFPTSGYLDVYGKTGSGICWIDYAGTETCSGEGGGLTGVGEGLVEAAGIVSADQALVGLFSHSTADAAGSCGIGRVHLRTDTNDYWRCTSTDTWTKLAKPNADMVTAAVTLTADLPVIGGGSKALALGSKTGNTNELVTQAGAKTAGKQMTYDANGNAVASIYDVGAAGTGGGEGAAAYWSQSIDFASISDGGTGSATMTATGAAVGMALAESWPATLPAGLAGSMRVSAANTITVTLQNLSGAAIDLGALTYGARSGGAVEVAISLQAANCRGTSAGTGFALPATNAPAPTCVTGTNTNFGVLAFDAATDESIQTNFKLPANWVGDVDLDLDWRAAATTGDTVYGWQIVCVADGETGDPAFNAAQTVTDTAKGTTLQFNSITKQTGITMTGCTADKTVFLKVYRDADNAADTMTGDAQLINVRLTLRRTQ